jgi:hypothetical protein
MEPVTEIVRKIAINSDRDRYVLTLDSEDFSLLYPCLIRFTLSLKEGERTISVFRSNSYEYSPLVTLTAENVAKRTADEWEQEIRNNRGILFLSMARNRCNVLLHRILILLLSREARGQMVTAVSLPVGRLKQHMTLAGRHALFIPMTWTYGVA